MFKTLRIGILLFILANVAIGAWLGKKRSTSWERTLRVVVYPINADASQASADYIAGLSHQHWQPIEVFVANHAQQFGVQLSQPVQVRLGPQVHSLPPAPPANGNVLQIALWSLQLRYWSWLHDDVPGARPDVRLFALYHNPATTPRVAHSLGLQQGLIGVANLFAERGMSGGNQVVLTHELLHTVGARDKYHPGDNLPVFPDGYANPDSEPLYPQQYAEIMAGRIALGETEASIPRGLADCVIGPATAREINWLK